MDLPLIFVMCNPIKEAVRYNFLIEHFPKRGIPLEKVEFIYGKWGDELTSAEVFQVYDPFKERFGMNTCLTYKSACLTNGELSLILTFRKTIARALEKSKDLGKDRILIFESDVCLREDFLERLGTVLKDNKEWDYISLGEGCFLRPVCAPATYFGPTKLYPAEGQWVFRCCDSMLFRRSFLEKLSQSIVPIRECLDWELNIQIALWQGKALWVDPPICEPGSGRWKNPSNLNG